MSSKSKYRESHNSQEWRVVNITSQDGSLSEMKIVEAEQKPAYVIAQKQGEVSKGVDRILGQCEVQEIPGSSQHMDAIVQGIIKNYYEKVGIHTVPPETTQSFQLQVGQAKSNIFKLQVSQPNLLQAIELTPALKGQNWGINFLFPDSPEVLKMPKFKKWEEKKKHKHKGKGK
ncbi:hypothetical protein KKD70_00955 [Patescibacteria group bacterium]|nr:hypothetical protein [Patescibacteria group bacterium]